MLPRYRGRLFCDGDNKDLANHQVECGIPRYAQPRLGDSLVLAMLAIRNVQYMCMYKIMVWGQYANSNISVLYVHMPQTAHY